MSIKGTILLIGGSGMLGRAWRELLRQKHIPFSMPEQQYLNITNPEHLATWITPEFPVVINCAAWTDVDKAESEPDAAHRLNAEAPGELATRCSAAGSLLVHYSTDYIFDGRLAAPYSVHANPDPINVYGKSKLQGEAFVRQIAKKHLIIRTSWLYAAWGRNFVRTIAKLAKDRPALKVVNDQHGRPTSAVHLAATSLKLIEKNRTGTWHVTDGGECTWFDFASQIVQLMQLPCKVEPCTTEQHPRPAQRPPRSVLDLSETEKLLGPMPFWTSNLRQILLNLEHA